MNKYPNREYYETVMENIHTRLLVHFAYRTSDMAKARNDADDMLEKITHEINQYLDDITEDLEDKG